MLYDALNELLETFDTRELQLEAARVISSHPATNVWVNKFKAQHDSAQFYKMVVTWYINEYGGMPSEVGPAKEVKLLWTYDTQN